MTANEILTLAGLLLILVMGYVGWVHYRTARLDDRIDRCRDQVNELRTEMVKEYVDKSTGQELFLAVRDIRQMIADMSSRIEILFDRHEHRK